MLVRPFQPGDGEQQAIIYTLATANLPGCKLATPDEVRRRTSAHGFDPTTRLYAEVQGKVVGYSTFDPVNGRVSYPWTLPGCEGIAEQLFVQVLEAMKQRGLTLAFTAYRSDWAEQHQFFEVQGFTKTREMVNFTQSISDLPTMFQRPGLNIVPVTADALPEIERLCPTVLGLSGPALADYLLRNSRFPERSVVLLRHRDGGVKGVGVMIDEPTYADVGKIDPKMPCFRFGAFGTEGQNTKRVNGLFSFLAADDKEAEIVGQDLLWHSTSRLETSSFSQLAAQAPSDAPHLIRFYTRYFQKQASFPIYSRLLG